MGEAASDRDNVRSMEDYWEEVLRMTRMTRELADVVEREVTLRLYGSFLATDLAYAEESAKIEARLATATDADTVDPATLLDRYGLRR